jgi:sporulation protein YlmC with PRC-barrel domain
MLILYSKLVGLPIIELENQSKLASVLDVVIEPKNGKVLGLIAKVGNLLPRDLLVAARDLSQVLPTAILVADVDRVTAIDEVVRANELYKKHFTLYGKKVVTESGKLLGKVNDYLIDDELLTLAKLYIRHLFSDRIIPYTAVVRIDDKAIVVKDDFEAISASAEANTVIDAERC